MTHLSVTLRAELGAKGVRVTAIDIDAAEGSVRIEVEHASVEALMRYVSDLNAGEEKPRWQLLQLRAPTAAGSMGTAQLSSRWAAGD